MYITVMMDPGREESLLCRELLFSKLHLPGDASMVLPIEAIQVPSMPVQISMETSPNLTQ